MYPVTCSITQRNPVFLGTWSSSGSGSNNKLVFTLYERVKGGSGRKGPIMSKRIIDRRVFTINNYRKEGKRWVLKKDIKKPKSIVGSLSKEMKMVFDMEPELYALREKLKKASSISNKAKNSYKPETYFIGRNSSIRFNKAISEGLPVVDKALTDYYQLLDRYKRAEASAFQRYTNPRYHGGYTIKPRGSLEREDLEWDIYKEGKKIKGDFRTLEKAIAYIDNTLAKQSEEERKEWEAEKKGELVKEEAGRIVREELEKNKEPSKVPLIIGGVAAAGAAYMLLK